MNLAGRLCALFVAVLAASAACETAGAQSTYPDRPIRIFVPFPPAGSNDVLARLIGKKLEEAWHQPVIVENRVGANGTIGTAAMIKAPADGYTLLMTSDTHILTPLFYPTPYDALKDVAAITTIASSELLLVVNPTVAASTLAELVALAKSRPGAINYATPGAGNTLHLATELLSTKTGIKLTHVPYKGAPPAVTDLLGGQVQMMISPPTNVVEYVKSGRLRAIAISGPDRLPALPNVPTFAEAGVKEFEVKFWTGLLAPAGTPTAIVNRIAGEVAKIVAQPDVGQALLARGMSPFTLSPEQFTALLDRGTLKYRQIIKDAGIKLEQ